MFESIVPSPSARPKRRLALTAAALAHLAVGGSFLLTEAWRIEAVSPPDLPLVFRGTRSIPVLISTPDPRPPVGAPPRTRLPSRPDPGPRQPAPVPSSPEPTDSLRDPGSGPGSRDGSPDAPPGPIDPNAGPDGPSGPIEPPPPPPPPDDGIYDAARVDVKPARQADCADPRYPAVARAMHLQGDVRLSAVINEQGQVEQIQVVSGNPILAQAAVDAASRCRYAPARLRGRAVRSLLTWDVHFVLH